MRLRPFVLALLGVALLAATRPAAAVDFSTYTDLEGIDLSAVAWGDYDNDGDLDLAVAGENATPARVTRIYAKSGAGYADLGAGLVGLKLAALAWGDYDGDGDLDLAAFGNDATNLPRGILYRNDGGTLVDAAAGLVGLEDGSARWGDIDNDGDLDLLACGRSGPLVSSGRMDLYRNIGGVLAPVVTSLPGISLRASIDLGDMDGDGDLDLAMAGSSVTNTALARVYRNDGGTWANIGAPMLAVLEPSVEWGDLDADGDLDLVQTGVGGGNYTRVLSNNGFGGFVSLATYPDGVRAGGARWADADGDGDDDLLRWGAHSSTLSQVGTNTAGAFAFATSSLTAVQNGGATWADADGDGDPDVALSGRDPGNVRRLRVHLNTGGPANLPPGAPGGLDASVVMGANGARVTFTWSHPTDDHTPQAGLTYELRIGTTPGGAQVTGASADAATGFRRVARLGAMGSRTSWELDLPFGTYSWSVQAIDGARIGGTFAGEQTLVISPLEDSGIALTEVMGRGSGNRPCATWADSDQDGDLDLLVLGNTTTSSSSAQVRFYRNDGGTLVSIATTIPALGSAAAAWGDYDNDGDLDVVVCGTTAVTASTRLMRNDGGTFVAVEDGLPEVGTGAVAWADVDNDGDLDLFLGGQNSTDRMSGIYLNSGGVFADGDFGLVALGFSSAAFADFDRDADPDLVLCGIDPFGIRRTLVYRNDGAGFMQIASLTGMSGGNVIVGNIDDNGTPDIVVTGAAIVDLTGGRTQVYLTNEAGTAFADAGTPFPGGLTSSVAFGDYDADGDLDLAFAGYDGDGTSRSTRLARNDAGVFTVVASSLVPVAHAALAWADVDGDGRLDLAVLGSRTGSINSPSSPVAKLYRNVMPGANVPPPPPAIQQVSVNGSSLEILATGPSGDATPLSRMTYDVQLGTTVSGGQIVSLPSLLPSGTRTLAREGSIRDLATWHVDGLAPGVYYLRLQAVDASFAGSALDGWTGFAFNVVGAPGDLGPPAGTLALRAVTPNPMTAQARIDYDLPRTSDVELGVYDVAGRRVRTLLRERMAAGRQVALWDGADDGGHRSPAGVYFVRLAADGETRSQRVVRAR